LRAQVDGVERLYAYYRIPRYDLIVQAGLDVEDMLGPYRHLRGTLLLSLALVTLLSLGFGYSLFRRMAEREHREATLRDANALLERQVRARTEQLQQSVEEMESFSYSVAHDLSAPLRAVSGYVSIVREQAQPGSGDAIEVDLLSRIVASCKRMNDIVDGLLSLKHISRQPVEIVELDLSAKAAQVQEDLRMQSSGREVAFDIEPGLHARGDRALVRILLLNLLGNAWKFTARTPQARIEFGFDAGENAFRVRDNGAGFSMDYADKLFMPFTRLHSGDEFAGNGNGIGLVTAKRIVTRLGARIWASSAPGAGTTFWFTLEPKAARV
jgi:signal transduction histidine kinase